MGDLSFGNDGSVSHRRGFHNPILLFSSEGLGLTAPGPGGPFYGLWLAWEGVGLSLDSRRASDASRPSRRPSPRGSGRSAGRGEGVYLLFLRVWNRQRLLLWAAMCVCNAAPKPLPKRTYLSFEPLPWLMRILHAQIHVGHQHVAQLADPHPGEELEPKQERVLGVIGLVHLLVDLPEVVGVVNLRQLPVLLGRAKLACLPHPLGHIPPALVVQPSLADQPDDLAASAQRITSLTR